MSGGIVAHLREWNKDIFVLASLTAKLLQSSNSKEFPTKQSSKYMQKSALVSFVCSHGFPHGDPVLQHFLHWSDSGDPDARVFQEYILYVG